MQTPRLLVRKAMMNIQGKTRPCIQVQASIDPAMAALLSEHFLAEVLFKRSSYASGWPAGAPLPSPSLAPHLGIFVKNDACPEITVKTILAGQMHQAATMWELLAFEYVAKRAFDSLVDLMASASELGTETRYLAPGTDLTLFAADAASETAAAPAAVAPRPQGMANAA